MNADIREIRNIVAKLFVSQMGAARELGFSERQVRNWCTAYAPPHVLKALRRMLTGDITLRTARRLLRTKRERRIVKNRKIKL